MPLFKGDGRGVGSVYWAATLLGGASREDTWVPPALERGAHTAGCHRQVDEPDRADDAKRGENAQDAK